jgi:hypothetical protein
MFRDKRNTNKSRLKRKPTYNLKRRNGTMELMTCTEEDEVAETEEEAVSGKEDLMEGLTLRIDLKEKGDIKEGLEEAEVVGVDMKMKESMSRRKSIE